MKYIKITPVFIVIVFLLFVFSCSKSVNSPDDNSRPNDNIIGYTPEEIAESSSLDGEAGLMALWYGNKLIADIEMYNRFFDGITSLREKFVDSIPETAIPFFTPWAPGQLLIGLNDSAHTAYENGVYTAWDFFNESFLAEEIKLIISSSELYWYRLTFAGTLHPHVLATYYDTLPGIMFAEANGYIGDWPCVYPWFIDDTLTFLVRNAWEDCPSGCINSHFFYFKETSAGFELIGSWLKWDEPEPDWWSEAKVAYETYRFGWPE